MAPDVPEAEEVTIEIDDDKADTPAINKMLLDDAALCPLAPRVPAAKWTGNTLADAAALQQREQLVQLIDSLSKDPALVSPLYSHLLLVVRERALAVGDTQFKCATHMNKLDEDWVADWITAHSSLSAEQVSQARLQDPLFFQHIMVFALQLPATVRLPPLLKNKAVAWGTFEPRHHQLGDRLNKLSNCIGPNGQFLWSHGSYKLISDQGSAKSIQHVSGSVAELPAYVNITRDFTIEHKFDDKIASANLGAATYVLMNFFPPAVGPNAFPKWNSKSSLLNDLSKVEHAKVVAAERIVAKGTSSAKAGDVLAAAQSERKRGAAQKAREALLSKTENLKKQRRVTLMTT